MAGSLIAADYRAIEGTGSTRDREVQGQKAETWLALRGGYTQSRTAKSAPPASPTVGNLAAWSATVGDAPPAARHIDEVVFLSAVIGPPPVLHDTQAGSLISQYRYHMERCGRPAVAGRWGTGGRPRTSRCRSNLSNIYLEYAFWTDPPRTAGMSNTCETVG